MAEPAGAAGGAATELGTSRPVLWLHIGHSKVASSSIQAFLNKNLDALRAQGFLVMDSNGEAPTSGAIDANPVGYLQLAMDAGERGVDAVRRRLQEVHALLRGQHHFRQLLISAENVCNPPMERMFAEARALFDVRVLYYIRRQDEWLISAWKQWGVKFGMSLEDYCLDALQTRYPAFADAIALWEPLCDRMHVRLLHPEVLTGGSVTHDFAAAIGLPPDGLEHVGVTNPSFDAAVLDLLAHNPDLFEYTDDNRVFDFLGEWLPKGVKQKRAILERRVRQQICGSYEEENRALHRRFFPQVPYERLFGLDTIDDDGRKPTEGEQIWRYLALQLRGLMPMHTELQTLRARIAELERMAKNQRRSIHDLVEANAALQAVQQQQEQRKARWSWWPKARA